MSPLSLMRMTHAGRRRALLLALAFTAALLMAAQPAGADTASYPTSATALPFPADTATGGGTWMITDTACETSHTCLTVGAYTKTDGEMEAYVVSIVDGVPSAARAVPLPKDAATNPEAELQGVSCAGDTCEAYGLYQAGTLTQPMVVQITAGVPAQAIPLAAPGDATDASRIYTRAISCWSSSGCVAVGYYANVQNQNEAFVLPILGGVPQALTKPQLPSGSDPDLNAVACQPTGACVAVGVIHDSPPSTVSQAVSVPINDGSPGQGVDVPAPSDGAQYPNAVLNQVACPPSGA
jgi:hypothetical protein